MRTLITRILAVAALAAVMALPVAAHAAPKTVVASADKDKADKPAPSGTVNLNTATAEQLEMLPGVGPSKAEAIVAWRKKHGAFKKVDDLTRVKGFGRKTLQKLRPYLAVSGATTFMGAKPPADTFFGRPPAQEAP
jgi:competence protein ComEA